MSNIQREKVAGLCINGGRKENFFFCLLEHFPENNRWSLSSLLPLREEEVSFGEQAIRKWISDSKVEKLIIDFPTGLPHCQSCDLECPGQVQCPEESVVNIRQKISKLLEEDQKIYEENKKAYEKKRLEDEEFNFNKNFLAKESNSHLLSKSIKRRLKKGYLPYWNRPVDLWVWSYYYDPLLSFWDESYDSFGQHSLMLVYKLQYLKRHFPNHLELYEGHINISLLELLRAEIITKQDIFLLVSHQAEDNIKGRGIILDKLEKKLNLFIYGHDMDLLIQNQKAFNSFVLSICGQRLLIGKTRDIPEWTIPQQNQLVVPVF